MDDGSCIRLPREIIECGKTATDVGYAQNPPVRCVEYFRLRVNLILRPRVRRGGLTSRSRCWTRQGLHFGGQ